MEKFNFERNLAHQSRAVESTLAVFNGVEKTTAEGIYKNYLNPVFNTESRQYSKNIRVIQEENDIERNIKKDSKILDIMMETGTGKTYTYTKTIFELNKFYGIFKFVIVVPTLPIKAGTINFLKSDSCKEHFDYGKSINLHIVESKKNGRKKKSFMPSAVSNFVNSKANEKKIQVLVINTGMINSLTMQEDFDKTLLDQYTNAFASISATQSFFIIDEPHKFGKDNKTWKNIQKMNPQFIIRYGATFKENENLIYQLTSVDSFKRNLIKGVIGHISEFERGSNTIVKFVSSDGTLASFELIDGNLPRKTLKIAKKETLKKIHQEMADLYIEKLNKTTVVLSNGLELTKGAKINPFSYNETLQGIIIQKAIQEHFIQEKKYLTREDKIKPLTLFFIDNIEEYRNAKKEGYIRQKVEKCIQANAKKLLKTESNDFYREYLEKTLKDISKTHGGYFSKDNKNTDEAIEKEVNEILNDKQALLDLENPRRFIFSKWTLKEGWDNPNIFQICKLRSSGSEISKLQEVGRGLRLPVNQYGNRVKDEQFFLNYFVDFTESDFVEKLISEINQKSGAISREDIPLKITDEMIKEIEKKYNINEKKLLETLDNENIINRANEFKKNGFDHIKEKYPLIFTGVDSNKIKTSTDTKKKIGVRTEKYSKLKDLWEKLNEKVILEYKIENEEKFKELWNNFLENVKWDTSKGIDQRRERIKILDDKAVINKEESIKESVPATIPTMKYSDFLKELAKELYINIKTLHHSFIEKKIKIDEYLSQSTVRDLKQKFNQYLMAEACSQFKIEYQKVTSSIHPTKITDKNGEVVNKINASDIGVLYDKQEVDKNYFFDKLYYDSELEKENIKTNIKEVIVFTKIPKNSIQIPVAGGKSYSPDFAYVLNLGNNEQKIYFIVETKNTEESNLRDEEKYKIKHAEKFFENQIKIKFTTQFKKKEITDLIKLLWNK